MFRDRLDAAERLARALARYRGAPDALVLAVPRGGLPIGGVLARELRLKLDVILTKKIGHPDNPEFAIGAVSLTDATVDAGVVERDGIAPEYIAAQVSRIRESLRRKYLAYGAGTRPLAVAGKTVILTDDGAATGRTLLAAIPLLKSAGARRVVVAIPVAPRDAVAELERGADEVVCLEVPDEFRAIGEFYGDFSQVPDEDAVAILRGGAFGAGPA